MTEDDLREDARQQFEGLWEWSRFYHDAEIKVNGGAVVIAALAPITDKVAILPVPVAGVVTMIASGTALISTIGYWRYYEFCDAYAKKFRELYMDEHVLEAVQNRTNSSFSKYHPILSIPIFKNVHHLVWIVTQLLLFGLGFWITFCR